MHCSPAEALFWPPEEVPSCFYFSSFLGAHHRFAPLPCLIRHLRRGRPPKNVGGNGGESNRMLYRSNESWIECLKCECDNQSSATSVRRSMPFTLPCPQRPAWQHGLTKVWSHPVPDCLQVSELTKVLSFSGRLLLVTSTEAVVFETSCLETS
jgi:hypothetical protein